MSEQPKNTADTDQSRHDVAGKYALGLLEGRARNDFEAELKTNETLQEEVRRWRAHFEAVGMDLDEVSPPIGFLGNLKRELWGENRLPWGRRMRLWEYALGGIAAALTAYAVYAYGSFSDLPTSSKNDDDAVELITNE